MKIVIIEDEKPAARRLKSLLEDLKSIEVVVVLESVLRAKEWFEQKKDVDLIFSDIQLGDGLSFDIFSELNIKTPIVFTTAFNEYALEAFKHNSIDYLLKPFDKLDLEKSVNKFRDFPQPNNINFNQLLSQISVGQTTNYKKRFLVNKADQMISVNVDDLGYVFTEDKTTIIKTIVGDKYFFKSSLDDLEEELDPNLFFRVSRNMIVHNQAIKKITNYFGGTLKLELTPTHESEVTVSRRRVTDFKIWLNT